MTTDKTVAATPDAATERASALLGQTQGAMVLVGAGFGWMIWGLSALGAVPLTWFLSVIVVASLLLCGGWAVRQAAPCIPEAPWSTAMRRGFWLAVIGEVVGGVFFVMGAVLLHRPDWIAPLVALAVGLHFLPLAHLFRRPLYYVTGAALCLVCLLTVAFAPQHWGAHHVSGWLLATGLGSGTVLWLSALWMLVQSGVGLGEYSRQRIE